VKRARVVAVLIILTTPLWIVSASASSNTSVETRTNAGIGSTIASMKSDHGRSKGSRDVCHAANACFGPALKNDESGNTFLFTDALTDGGLISGSAELCSGNIRSCGTVSSFGVDAEGL
jgi:hypothetical protein